MIERHDKLEGMIGDERFLVADRPTLADGVLIGVARWLDFHAVADRDRWPRLAALRSRIEADPAVVRAAALERGEVVEGGRGFEGHVDLEGVIARFGNPNT